MTFLSADEWQLFTFTVAMAVTATVVLLVPGIALAWLLARRSWPGKSIVETLVALPLVMPPVATGLILLRLFGRRGVARWVPWLDFVFTWRAVVAAMTVMAAPLLIRAARIAFLEVNPRLELIARSLGATERRVFFTVTLPLAKRGVLGGALLAFARSLGEFGATILVAGNIPGRTSTLAVAIYSQVQLGHDREAFRLVALGIAVAFLAVWGSEQLMRRGNLLS